MNGIEELAATANNTRELLDEYLTAEAREHDEAMRMQALAIGVNAVQLRANGDCNRERLAIGVAAWAYREATGREWERGE